MPMGKEKLYAYICFIEKDGRWWLSFRFKDGTEFRSESDYASKEDAENFLADWCREIGIKFVKQNTKG